MRPTLTATIEAIKEYRTADLEAESKINSDLSEFSISVSSTQKDEFCRSIQEKYIDDLITQLENCSPDSVEVEAFLLIFDPSTIPSLSTELSTYGSEKLAVIGEKHASGDDADFQIEDLRSEWESFRHLLSGSYRGESIQGVLKKRVETELRNRLITTKLDHLVRISISGPDLKDCDFDQAVDEWGTMRNRRIQI